MRRVYLEAVPTVEISSGTDPQRGPDWDHRRWTPSGAASNYLPSDPVPARNLTGSGLGVDSAARIVRRARGTRR